MKLAAIFLEEHALDQSESVGALEDALAALIEQGEAAWPELTLASDSFVRFLARRVSTSSELLTASVRRAHGVDLFLTCACLQGQPHALRSFDFHYLRRLPFTLGRLRMSDDKMEELLQSLREHLLLAPPGTMPRIDGYHGRASLMSWLRVVALNQVSRWRSKMDVYVEEYGARRLPESLADSVDVEANHLRRVYQVQLHCALRCAFLALSAEEREMIHLYYKMRCTTRQLAAKYGISQPTISRRIRAILHVLSQEVRLALHAQLRMSKGASLSSIIRLALSQFDLHLFQP